MIMDFHFGKETYISYISMFLCLLPAQRARLIGFQLPPPHPAHYSIHFITFWKLLFFSNQQF